MHRFWIVLAAAALAAAPRPAAAQAGGFPVQTTAATRFVFVDGEVVRRDGAKTTPLTQNVRLRNGTKINRKNGIVEMPPDKLNPTGKKLTLHEGDYVRPDGGIVFATPTSAATARGEAPGAVPAKFEPYVQHGPGYDERKSQLLTQKIDLLRQKVALLDQPHPDTAHAQALNNRLKSLDEQLKALEAAPARVK